MYKKYYVNKVTTGNPNHNHEGGHNMGKNQHVTPHPDGGWQVKGEGNEKATVRTSTQAEAIDIARDIAINQQSEVVIHRPNGQIRDKNSYGNDPFPPKG
jgi:hypothetical protein